VSLAAVAAPVTVENNDAIVLGAAAATGTAAAGTGAVAGVGAGVPKKRPPFFIYLFFLVRLGIIIYYNIKNILLVL
jgi:hypothetical protein